MRRLAPWAFWLVSFAVVVAALVPVRGEIEQSHVALTLMLVVLGGSAGGGRWLGLTLAVIGFLTIDYAFQPPYGAFAVGKALDWVVLVAFLSAAFVATELLTRARQEAAAARARTSEVASLSQVGAETLRYGSADETLGAIAALARQMLRADRCAIHDASNPSGAPFVASEGDVPPGGFPVANEVSLPLRVADRTVGELIVSYRSPLVLDDARRRFLDALGNYAAIGLERRRLAKEAEEAQALRAANRAKDEVLAAVSHDLRTPLTTIKLLAQGASLDRKTAGYIEEEADRLSRMVSDLLDLSRIRVGGIALEREMNTAEDLVGASIQRAQGVLNGRRIVAHLDMGNPALAGRFDFVQAVRIVGNLIDNALRFSPEHGVVEVSTERENGWMVVRVADRGPGVPPEEATRIFEPFYRPRGEPADIGRAGLGLSIARQLAEIQGGSVDYALRDGGGSVFTLRLRAADWSAETMPE